MRTEENKNMTWEFLSCDDDDSENIVLRRIEEIGTISKEGDIVSFTADEIMSYKHRADLAEAKLKEVVEETEYIKKCNKKMRDEPNTPDNKKEECEAIFNFCNNILAITKGEK